MVKKSLSPNSKINVPKKNLRKDLMVVGLGASAGGVKALRDFFSLMPPYSGMAFVVILHLSPDQESNLSEILQTKTAMPVKPVSRTLRVEPNTVYVIPPNRRLEMKDGVIRSVKANGERGTPAAIDVFFRSLAEVYRENAVCIVLTGTGTDGTLGLRAVKESNGFAIVQDPEEAEFDSMPKSAIATNLADLILPVPEMPERLIRFRDSSEKLRLTEGDAPEIVKEIETDDAFREILTLLRIHSGHDFSNYKAPTLVRRIARQLQIHDLEDIKAYLDFLRSRPEEIQTLLKNLLINVTNFFRDKEAWADLQNIVVPELFAGKKAGETVRVWSCGCSSGEEAYSLAIILSEFADKLKRAPKIQIFATDVNMEAITEGREHLYPQSIEADVSPERLKRFFVRKGRYYRVNKELREMVLFAPHNVLRDPPFSRLNLIVCRNLLIYLNPKTQESVMEIFHFALAPNSYLFLGNSETNHNMTTLFETVDKKSRIFKRRQPKFSQSGAPRLPVAGRWEIKLPNLKNQALVRSEALNQLHYKLLEKISPASVLVNQDFDILYLSGNAGRFLTLRGGEPSNNLIKLVNTDLLSDLRNALFNVQHEHQIVEYANVRVCLEDRETTVNLIVSPVEIDNEISEYMLVVFDENKKIVLSKEDSAKAAAIRALEKDEAMESVILQLEQDLARTKDNLRATIEQHEISIEELKAANEELQARNEELRTTTEELESSKEEMQSVNEELTTVNNELKEKIDELALTHSDLQNLMASTEIATIFLDRQLRIKRLTPLVEQLFNITLQDIGRPLEHFTHKLEYKNLAADAAEVLRRLTPLETEFKDSLNRTFLARFAPYRTVDDRIEGVVLNFVDITALKQAEEKLRRVAELDAFRIRLSDALRPLQNSEEIKSVALRLLGEQLQADNVFYFEVEAEGDKLVHAADYYSSGKSSGIADGKRIQDFSRRVLGELRQNRPVIVSDTQKDSKDSVSARARYQLLGVRALVYFPLVREDRLSAILGITQVVPRDWSEEELAFVRETAERTWLALERVRMENTVRETETHLAAILDDAKIGISEISPDGRFLRVNESLCRMLGRSRAELLKLNFAEIAAADDERKCRNALRILAETGEPVSLDQRFQKGNGEMIWAHSTLSLVQTNNRQPWIIKAVTINLTESKRAEEAARKSEERMRIAIEAARLATWELDLTTGNVYWNKRHFTLFGMRPKNKPVTLETFFRRVHPNERERLKSELEKTVAEKGIFDSEFAIVRTDGATRWMCGYGQVTEESADGKPLRMNGVMYDITERKLAEEARRQSEEQLTLILESTRDYAIITFDLKGRITRWNAGAEKIFGYTENEAVGQMTHLIFTPEDRAAMVPEKELLNTLENGRAEDERWHLRKDGSRFFASGVMQLLHNGEIEGFVKIARDQTAKIEAEQSRLEQAMLRRLVSAQEDERRRIARDIHDHFGQKITALRLQIDSIKKLVGDDEKFKKLTDDAQKTAADLDADVDFIAWELRPAALDDLGLRVTLANFVAEWSNHTGIRAEFHSSGLSRSRLATEIETNLYRIAQEALNNIQKHAGAENVSVLLEKRKNRVLLIIEDDGVGFNPLEKANRTKGLGLVGMSERARICGGTLEIESAKGKGTTIFARIPLVK